MSRRRTRNRLERAAQTGNRKFGTFELLESRITLDGSSSLAVVSSAEPVIIAPAPQAFVLDSQLNSDSVNREVKPDEPEMDEVPSDPKPSDEYHLTVSPGDGSNTDLTVPTFDDPSGTRSLEDTGMDGPSDQVGLSGHPHIPLTDPVPIALPVPKTILLPVLPTSSIAELTDTGVRVAASSGSIQSPSEQPIKHLAERTAESTAGSGPEGEAASAVRVSSQDQYFAEHSQDSARPSVAWSTRSAASASRQHTPASMFVGFVTPSAHDSRSTLGQPHTLLGPSAASEPSRSEPNAELGKAALFQDVLSGSPTTLAALEAYQASGSSRSIELQRAVDHVFSILVPQLFFATTAHRLVAMDFSENELKTPRDQSVRYQLVDDYFSKDRSSWLVMGGFLLSAYLASDPRHSPRKEELNEAAR